MSADEFVAGAVCCYVVVHLAGSDKVKTTDSWDEFAAAAKDVDSRRGKGKMTRLSKKEGHLVSAWSKVFDIMVKKGMAGENAALRLKIRDLETSLVLEKAASKKNFQACIKSREAAFSEAKLTVQTAEERHQRALVEVRAEQDEELKNLRLEASENKHIAVKTSRDLMEADAQIDELERVIGESKVKLQEAVGLGQFYFETRRILEQEMQRCGIDVNKLVEQHGF